MPSERELEIEQPVGPRIYPPWGGEGFAEFSIPEYIGKSDKHSYAVSQQMLWVKSPTDDNMLSGELDVHAEDVGYDFHANLTTDSTEDVRIDLSMRNTLNEEITQGHHTVLLDLSAMPGFEDPDGMNTVVYTEAGWTQLAKLVKDGGIENVHETIRTGGSYGKHTILWDIIVRLDQSRQRMVALMMNKAYAFSADHPDWGTGLLAGCRWNGLAPSESRRLIGWIFLLNANMQAIEQRYGKARRIR